MADLFLYPCAANPKDVTLRDPTTIAGGLTLQGAATPSALCSITCQAVVYRRLTMAAAASASAALLAVVYRRITAAISAAASVLSSGLVRRRVTTHPTALSSASSDATILSGPQIHQASAEAAGIATVEATARITLLTENNIGMTWLLHLADAQRRKRPRRGRAVQVLKASTDIVLQLGVSVSARASVTRGVESVFTRTAVNAELHAWAMTRRSGAKARATSDVQAGAFVEDVDAIATLCDVEL